VPWSFGSDAGDCSVLTRLKDSLQFVERRCPSLWRNGQIIPEILELVL